MKKSYMATSSIQYIIIIMCIFYLSLWYQNGSLRKVRYRKNGIKTSLRLIATNFLQITFSALYRIWSFCFQSFTVKCFLNLFFPKQTCTNMSRKLNISALNSTLNSVIVLTLNDWMSNRMNKLLIAPEEQDWLEQGRWFMLIFDAFSTTGCII